MTNYIKLTCTLVVIGLLTSLVRIAPADDLVEVEADGEDLDLLDMALEDLLNTSVEVWSATKTKASADEVPTVITVITKEEIRHWSYRSLDEILRHVSGFYVVDDHIIPNLGVRGVAGGLAGESGTIKLMIDGQSTAFRTTSGNWLGPELIPMSAIERIEIIRGPTSALYGADAFLGIINIVTQEGEALSGGVADGHVSTTTHRHIGGGIDTTAGARKGPVDILLSARFNSENRSGLEMPASSPAPAIPTYNVNDITASHLDMSSKVGLAKIAYHINDKHTLTLSGYISTLDRGAEFSQWAPLSYGFSDNGVLNSSRVALYNGFVGLASESNITENFALDAKVHYFYGGPQNDDRIEVGSPLYYIRRDFGYRGVDGSLEGRWVLGKRLTLVMGTEVIYDMEDLPSSLHVLKTASGELSPGEVLESNSTRQGEADFLNFGAFGQAILSPIEKYLSLVGGVRYDHHNVFGSQASGRFGAVTNPVKPLYLKVLYSSAYKAPSPLLLHATPYQVGDIVGNPDLEPQYVHSVEGQLSLKWKYFSASSGVAYNLLSDKAEFVQVGVNRTAENLSQTGSLSWETELRASYKEWVSAYVMSEVQRTRRELGMIGYQAELYGNGNVVYPPYIIRMGLRGKFPKTPLAASVNGVYAGPRPSSDMNSLENFGTYTLDPYFLLGASLSVNDIEFIKDKETAFVFSAKNILGATGPDSGFAGVDYPLAPRVFYLDIRQEF